MNEVLKMAVSLSFSGTLLMALLFLIRIAVKKWTSKGWCYYIWLIIIARLLLPFSPETSIAGNVIEQTDFYAEQIKMQVQEDKPPMFIIPEPVQTEVQTDNAASAKIFRWKNMLEAVTQNLGAIWLIIALIMLVRKITVYQSFVHYVRAGSTQVADIKLLELLGKIVEKEKIRVSVELFVNPLISSPILIGFFHPCIVFPSTEISSTDLSRIIQHELKHYKRKDMFYKWIVQITICLHWFNPFVYIMSHIISRDCELSCDEAVIRTLDVTERRSYGDALLNAVSTGRYRDSSVTAALGQSRELLKERLDAIMQYREKPKYFIFLSLLLTGLLLFGFVFTGAYQVNALANDTKQNESAEMENAIINGEKWYFIANETQLRGIGNTADSLSKKYLLSNDIELTSDWEPIGTANAPFTGVFDGNGSTLLGLSMKDPNAEIAGLFGYAKNAVFHNIELVDVDISSAGSNVENKKVDAVCAVPIDCDMTDNRVYQLENISEPVEMDTMDFKGKTYYLVFTEEQLRAISAGQFGMDKNFIQQGDIEMSADEWIPIGTYEDPFTGIYNGNGYEIKGLTMENPYAQIVGLFGYAKGAQIYNITMRDYDILSAAAKAATKGVAPIVVYPMGNTEVYDNVVYPKENGD
ncbi:MAG: M56 family metallopeptidase [Eubacteriales bacterium]|nr:M56 family metallopeptidase [Eubacteriales bacterium]